MKSIFHIIRRWRFLQYVIIIEFIDLWSGFEAIFCEAVIRAHQAWDQEVTSALSVITAVWPGTRQTTRTDKIKWGSTGWGGGTVEFLPVLCGGLEGRAVRLWPPIAPSPPPRVGPRTERVCWGERKENTQVDTSSSVGQQKHLHNHLS